MYSLGGMPLRNVINNNPPPPGLAQATLGSMTSLSDMVYNATLLPTSCTVLEEKKGKKVATPESSASNTPCQYRYEAAFHLYAMNWSLRKERDKQFRLAVGSCQDGAHEAEGRNVVQIVQLEEKKGSFKQLASFQHNYPANKIAWIPDIHGSYPDLLASSGDFLRIWKVDSNAEREEYAIHLALILNNSQNALSDGRQSLPLTSFDWNQADPSLLITASLDNSCTVWTLDTGQAIASSASKTMSSKLGTQLLAHEKHVYDVAWSHQSVGNRDIFASVGDEGSLRQFDLRNLIQSTVLYQDPQERPLVRLAWSKHQTNQLAFLAENSNEVRILDIRFTSSPLARLCGHHGNVNAFSWAPHSADHLVTVGDDKQVLIWDIQQSAGSSRGGPVLSYEAAHGAINQVAWSEVQPDWIAICYDKSLELLRFQ